jgi:ABC-type transporter Mla subunit MlaD
MTGILAKLSRDIQAIAQRYQRHAGTLESLRKDPTPGSARKFHKVFLLAAADINAFAGKIERQLPALEDAIERVNENYSGFIQMVDPSQENTREALHDLRTRIETLLSVAREAKESTGSFRKTSSEVAEQKLSQNLSRASHRQADALNGVITNIERVEAFCVKALGMIDDNLERNTETSAEGAG